MRGVSAPHSPDSDSSSVRIARVADADGMGGVQTRAWTLTLRDHLGAQALGALDARSIAHEWATALRRPPSAQHRVLVALDGRDVVGFAALQPSEDPDAAIGRDADMSVLVVDPGHCGHGHGSRLLSAVTDSAGTDGFTRLTTWVLAGDGALRAFLESAGWAPDGAHRKLAATDDPNAASVRQVRLHTALETP